MESSETSHKTVVAKHISTLNHCESSGTTCETLVTRAEEQPQVVNVGIVIGKSVHSFEYDKEKQIRKEMLPMTKVAKLRHNEYYNMQELFDELYAESQKGKVFDNLMEIIMQPENIKLAYRNIKRNNGSNTSGTDKCTIEDIKQIPTDKYVEMVQRKLKFYQPKPVKRVEIPKPNGKMRPLGIPTITDRLVQQSILQVLEPICEAKFHERNNGFRPNRSAENAIAQCYRMIQQQNLHFMVDIDIKSFFDNVSHSKLIKQMWTMGIRDKKLICIIKAMLKAPVIMPDGKTEYPVSGTPQGGILSPLLSNIVLNELDWWISSQWESMPTKYKYKCDIKKNGTECKSTIFKSLRRTKLKEIWIVRYADDFKIFCRTRSDADKTFIAVKQWLKERLKLQISEEKSKVINLKKHYSEYLGFKLKAVKKGRKYVVRSHMKDKAQQKVTEQLIEQIKKIQRPKEKNQSVMEINRYNQMVEGVQNYYQYATHINLDCRKIQRAISTVITNRLKERVEKDGIIQNKHILERYGNSRQMRFVNGYPIVPIGYVQTKNPMYKKKSICKYTAEGRKEIHKNLKFDEYVLWVMKQWQYSCKYTDSIEFTDNKISLYAAQYGKCAVLGVVLDIDDIHCHHKLPKKLGGKNNYQNLIIVHQDVHRLIHATQQATICEYLSSLKLDQRQINTVNKLRKMAGNESIKQNL